MASPRLAALLDLEEQAPWSTVVPLGGEPIALLATAPSTPMTRFMTSRWLLW
jgi:hypothetical protein